jgi:hypothetical protein
MMAASEIGAVRTLYGHVPRPLRKERSILVLQGYADDSGNHRESHVFVLAGFVAKADPNWVRFEEEWADALRKPPSLAYFKMSECHALRGQFLGWKEKDRDNRLAELVAIIGKTATASIFALVQRGEFLAAMPKIERRFFKTPYALVYYSLIWATLKSMHSCGITDKVDFVFDEQLRLSDDVQAIWGAFAQQAMRTEYGSLVGSRPIHGSDKRYVELQAADLLAWHIRRWYDADSKGKKFETPALLELRKIPHWGLVHSKESIANLLTIGRMRQQIMKELSREGRIGKSILDFLLKNDST